MMQITIKHISKGLQKIPGFKDSVAAWVRFAKGNVHGECLFTVGGIEALTLAKLQEIDAQGEMECACSIAYESILNVHIVNDESRQRFEEVGPGTFDFVGAVTDVDYTGDVFVEASGMK